MGMTISTLRSMLTPWRGIGILLFTLAWVKLFSAVIRYRKKFKFFNSLPGETDFSILWGNMHKLSGKSEERMAYVYECMLKHPRFFRIWLGPFYPMINLHHPETVRILLKSSEPKPSWGGYQFALPWLGQGLLIASGQRWARARRLLTPAFHFDILKPYMDIYNSSADILLGKILRFADSGESFELFGPISLCTLEIILKCAMSFDDDVQLAGESHPYVVAVHKITDLWFERSRNPWLYNNFIYSLTNASRTFKTNCKYVHSVAEAVIERRRDTFDKDISSQKRYLDFLDILLTARDDSGQGLNPLEIRNEVDTFLFEGHDTTASAISWILYSLAKHTDIQDKVQAEVDSILDGRDTDHIGWEDLSRLEYLGYVIKEGMRVHCPVPFIGRETTQTTVIDGVEFPKGTIMNVHILNLHRNPQVWEDPLEFKPERFFPENMKDRDSYAFVPFSAGPRNCIGQHFAMNEEKVLIARIVHRYRLSLDLSHTVRRHIAAVMRTEDGIKIFAQLRH